MIKLLNQIKVNKVVNFLRPASPFVALIAETTGSHLK